MAWPSNYTDGSLWSASVLNTLLTAIKSGGGQGTQASATSTGSPSSAGTATCNEPCFKVITDSVNTAAGGTYTLTITNSLVTANSIIFVTPQLRGSTAGTIQMRYAKPGAGIITIVAVNVHATDAFNGTIAFDVLVKN